MKKKENGGIENEVRIRVVSVTDNTFSRLKVEQISLYDVQLKEGVSFDLSVDGNMAIAINVAIPEELGYIYRVELDHCLPESVIPQAAINVNSFFGSSSPSEIVGIATAELIAPNTDVDIHLDDDEILFELAVENPDNGQKFYTETRKSASDVESFLTINSD